jgi:class 3 adenylate cyclase
VPGALFCTRCGTRLSPAAPAVPIATAEERKVVTVLFADLVGSTSLGEQLDPETMAGVLRTYFDAMREEAEAEGGTVEKFIGDAVMAAFGVPVVHEDDPERAVRAAQAMVRRLESVNDELRDLYGVTLHVRVGVNTGSVLAVLDAPPGEGMVTGDAVNVAARLQAAAGADEVLVSERTARAARCFTYADRGGLELKGKREPVRAFVVTGEASTPPRGFADLRAPMVGRDTELAVLESVLERASRERRPHLVTVYGEPGVGKSRLVREFVDRVQLDDPAPLVMRGRCLPYGDGVTYWPLAEILKAQAAVRDSDEPQLALSRIRAAVAELLEGRTAPVLPRVDPLEIAATLAYTLGLGDPEVPIPTLDPMVVRRMLHAAWQVFFSAAAENGPIVVVVEDIHWANPALLDLLEELEERVEGAAVFVCTSRPELVAERPGWGGGRRNAVSVALDRLDDNQAETLVRLLLDVDDLPGSVHARILERAEGNPFFLEEILRRLIDEGLVLRDSGRWRSLPGVETVDIPDTVQGVLAARIDLLDAADKRVLQAAAVVGRVFWTEPVDLLAGDGASLQAELARLQERDLVEARLGSALAGQAEYAFKHTLTRDVAYDGIPRRERSLSHSTVARWLERTTGDRAGEFSELLAYHYATAVELARESGSLVEDGLRRAAWSWLLRASSDTLCRHVLGRAQHLAEKALDLAVSDVERSRALEALGESYGADSRGDLSWEYLREAALIADAAPDIDDVRTAYLMARACERPVRWPGTMRKGVPEADVRALRDRGLELVPEGNLRERAQLLAVKAGWPFAFPDAVDPGEIADYREAGLAAAEIALGLDDADLASAALDQAAATDSYRGYYGDVRATWQRRYALRDRLSVDVEIADMYAMGSWIHFEVGRFREALDFARQIIGRTDEMMGGLHARAWEIATLYRLGRWDDALAAFHVMREKLDDRRDNPPNYATHAFGVAALIHQLRGERLEADRVANIVDGNPAGADVRSYPWRIWLRAIKGDVERAYRLLGHLPTSWRVHAGLVYEARCDAALAAGLWDQAPGLAVEVRAFARDAPSPAAGAAADRLDGAAALARGRSADAVDLLERSVLAFDELEVPLERGRAQLLLAQALRSLGKVDDAASAQAAADATLGALGVVEDRLLSAALRSADT